ncbi:transcription elongation factor GreA [Conexibacter sp. W3-3-2]|uniref:Transcription elongation factor GreA n=1 Tax=Paraconexibacter algicola TaxID=2133960 RepID=A0A2T4UDN2_9ACTN|nr:MULTISPECIES: transcription elongation factor GreA [Solirubrobacterales]MTD43879.1 transcription elongation factor GreA [Conexibacter sp. W3-3-2]PTL55611.1 transcription elongation factor GreA [Paraconexibacter algicola]
MSTPGGEAITAEGLEALKAELHELETTARADIAKRISFARDMGDLKENAEYHIAKEDQGHLETKILRLQERLRNAVVVEASGTDVVGFGSTVTVRDETSGKEATYTIVGPTEADASAGKLSAESPVAIALVGAKAGDTVEVQTPRGGRPMAVLRIG